MSKYLELKKRGLMMAANHWWQPSGVSIDQCVAAYRFKGADSMASALLDVTEHGWDLTAKGADGVSWDTVNGMYSTYGGYFKSAILGSVKGGLDNGRAVDSLAYQDVKTAVVWYYTGWRASNFEDHTHEPQWVLAAGFSHKLGYMALEHGYVNGNYSQWGADGYHFTNKPSIALTADSVKLLRDNYAWWYHTGAVMGASWGLTNRNWDQVSWAERDAFLGEVFSSNNMYFNGVRMTEEQTERAGFDEGRGWDEPHYLYWDNAGRIFSLSPFDTNHKPSQGNYDDAYYADDCMRELSADGRTWWVKKRILAASFYSVVLTDAQHEEVYRNMMSL